MQETWVWSLSQKDPPEKEMHIIPIFFPGISHGLRILVGYSPWGHKRVGHDWVTKQQYVTYMVPESVKWKWKSFSRVWLLVTHGLYRPGYWSGYHSLLQGIFPAQGSNPGLPHCRWILYQLSYQGSPYDTWLYHHSTNICQGNILYIITYI